MSARGDSRGAASVGTPLISRHVLPLFDGVPVFVVVTHGADHEVTVANDAFLDLVGLRDPSGRALGVAAESGPGPRLRALLDRVTETGQPVVVRAEPLVPAGSGECPSGRLYDVVAQPVLGSSAEVVGALLVGADVTGASRASESQRDIAERYRLLAESVPHLLWSAGNDGRIDYANAAAQALFGGGLAGASWVACVHPEDRKPVSEAWGRAEAAVEPLRVDARLLRASDGAWAWYAVHVVPIRDRRGRLDRWIGAATNVDEQKRAERVRARLAAELGSAADREQRRLGELLHDELQQHLVAARMSVGRLGRWLEGGDRPRDALADAERLLDDAIRKTRQLSHELCPPVLEREGLAQALAWLSDDMRAKHGLEVSVDLPEELAPASDEISTLLFKSVRELLFNVVKHAGTSSAAVAVRHEDDLLVVTVTDEGRGFDAEELHEPGASPAGLGLLTVRERLRQLGGDLEIDAASGRGACLRMLVPAAPRRRRPRRGRRGARRVPRR